MVRPDIQDTSLHGKPAPDICHFRVTLEANGELNVNVDVYTENTYEAGYAIKTGKENGRLTKGRKSMCGIAVSHYHINANKSVSGERALNYAVHPGYAITASGWGYLDDRQQLIDEAKQQIGRALIGTIDEAKKKLVNLMHPEAPPPMGADKGPCEPEPRG